MKRLCGTHPSEVVLYYVEVSVIDNNYNIICSTDHNMFVNVFYAGQGVLPEKCVEKSGGCRIYYGALGEIPVPTNLPQFMEESVGLYSLQHKLSVAV